MIPESARWLLFKGKVDKADKILRHIAEVNGKIVPQEFNVKDIDMVCINLKLFFRGFCAVINYCYEKSWIGNTPHGLMLTLGFHKEQYLDHYYFSYI